MDYYGFKVWTTSERVRNFTGKHFYASTFMTFDQYDVNGSIL